ncbi:MAG: 30S ribosomal protein S20 [Candidatus Saccharibacteria bacterium]|nr:30S ribosomal protein S20 [Candidatus Saccharibacteria bacterium]
MPIIKSAIKRMRQNAKQRARNVILKNDIKAATKAFRAKPSATTLSAAQSEYDKAVKKNLLKINTASRRKAQLAKEAKAAGVKLATGAKKAAKKAPVKKVVAKKPAAKKPAAKKTAKKA